MSAGPRLRYYVARAFAEEAVALLSPACERIEIAGSIRRKAETIGDIELVAVPRMRTELTPGSLFDGPEEIAVNVLGERVERLIAQGVLARSPRPANGERYRRLVHVRSGLQLDLFTVLPPAQWGVILAIRTGPAAYSQWLVWQARKRHFHVAGGALHRGGLGCGALPCEVVETPEERDLYTALGLPYQPPETRR